MTDLKLALKITTDGAGKARVDVDRLSDSVGKLGPAASKANTGMAALSSTAKMAGSAFAAIGVAVTAQEVVGTLATFDRLNASLKTVTGSTRDAVAAGEMLRKFATTTPYELEEVTQAFIRLRGLGLDATSASLRSYGNTASAMGKPMMQFIEAVADATTNEFERLKEFGIKAKQETDTVTFTFQGASTTIAKDAQSIQNYLLKIGNTQFASGMADQMDTIGGKLSNLKDSWANLIDTVGNMGLRDAIKASLGNASELLDDVRKGIDAITGSSKESQIALKEMALASAKEGLGELIKVYQMPVIGGRDSQRDAIAKREARIAELEKGLADLRSRPDTPKGPEPGKVTPAKTSSLPAGISPVKSKTSASAEARGDQYNDLFAAATKKYALPAGLLKAVAWQESKFDPRARSDAGAMGMMQFMPGTARRFGLKNPWDPAQSVDASGRYFKTLSGMFAGDQNQVIKMLASYNAGEGRVKERGLGYVLSPGFSGGQTRDYVQKILGKMGDYAQDTGGILSGALNLSSFDAELQEAEAKWKATLSRMVSDAEQGSQDWQEKIATQMVGLDAFQAAGELQREMALQGKEGADLVAQTIANAKEEAADLISIAEARARAQNAEITNQQNLLRSRIEAYQKEKAHLSEMGAADSERLAVDQRIAESQGEIARLDESRQRIAIETSEKVTAARAGEAKAIADARKPIQDMIKALEEEAEALKYTGAEMEVYKTRKEAISRGANESEIRQIEGLVRANQSLAKVRKAETDAAEVWAQAWEQAARRIDDTFRNLWADVFSGSKSVMDSIKSTFLDMLAEMAHAAITRPIMVQILGALGAPGGAGKAGGAQSGTGGVLGEAVSGGVSKALGGLFGGSGGAGAASGIMAGLGTAAMGAGIGMMVPGLLGIKGGGTVADQILPAAGGVGGAVLGSTVVAPAVSGAAFSMMGGVAGGQAAAMAAGMAASLSVPIVGAIIAAIMAIVSSTIKKAQPKMGATAVYNADNTTAVSGMYGEAGGDARQGAGILTALTGGFQGMERQLKVELGTLALGVSRQGRQLNLAGSAGGKQFFMEEMRGIYDKKDRINEDTLRQSFDRFQAAMLKRRDVLKQVDDELIKGAIITAQKWTELQGDLQRIAKLRAFQGRVASNQGDLDSIMDSYGRGSKLIDRITTGKRRKSERAILDQALGARFDEQVFGLRQSMDEATGSNATALTAELRGVAATMRDLRARDQALRDFAKRSKGKVSYTSLTEEEFASAEATAVRNVVEAYFEAASSGIESAMTSVKDSTQGILDELAGPEATLRRLSAEIGTGMASLFAATDPEQAADKAQEVTALILRRYEIEAQAIQEQIAAARSLKGLMEELQAGDLSALPWVDQFANTRSQFDAAAAKVQGGDTSAEALAELETAARSYLGFARDGYGAGSNEYRDAADSVSGIVGRYATPASVESEIERLNASAEAQLKAVTDALKPVLDAALKESATKVDAAIKALPQAVANGIETYLNETSPAVSRLSASQSTPAKSR